MPLSRIILFNFWAVIFGKYERIRDATPDTAGAAIEVPLNDS